MKFPDGRYDFDHSWNFISFTYSFPKNEATAAVHFGFSGETLLQTFKDNYKLTPKDLKFKIGPCKNRDKFTFQGHYHDVNFQYSIYHDTKFHLRSERDFIKYMKTRHAPKDTKPADYTKHLINSG